MSLWDKLLLKGFTYKIITHPLSFFDKIRNLFGANIKGKKETNFEHLIKIINGKSVEVFGLDIWYTRVTVDGETIFDARRFNDDILFDAINNATKKPTTNKEDKCICDMNANGEQIGGFCLKHKTDWL